MIIDLLYNCCFKTFENNQNNENKVLEISNIQLNLTPDSDIVTNNQTDTITNNQMNTITNNELDTITNNELDTVTIIHGNKTIFLPKLDVNDYNILPSKMVNPPIIIPKNIEKVKDTNIIKDNYIDEDGFVIL